ncbi:ABC transporter substrate-binding protein [Rhodococcus sp. BP22]|uniref:ABC transporter substrate-binding protein n=1 Tax=Rhodococcus sp. BP22 TaxID=2758566 RepID=UPI00164677D8|nr:ABC transporter substrate-binding protein [Rhodococcus sp. BP22]
MSDDAPSRGGQISYATYNGVSSLDPAARQDGGATGGTEMAAIYDLLIRYDLESREYVPQLGESLSGNDDSTEWTLTLRDGAKFNDGTPVDADAVVWSINRYVEKAGTHAQIWSTSVADSVARDSSTVVFSLKQPWNEFPSMLATGPGMIVAPSAEDGGQFTPVGAGPFTVDKFSPQEELILSARPDYWDGAPNVDTVRFPAIVSEPGKLETLQAGGIDLAYLRYPDNVHAALDAGLPGLVYSASMGGVGLINQREGRAGADLRVRKAIVAGIDPEAFDTRFSNGLGLPSSSLFQDWSEWDSDVEPSGYDPEAARRYLDEAKADGYDGKLTYVGMADVQKDALAFQAMLNSVGFDVEIDYVPNINALLNAVYVKNDYDLLYSGFNVLDESPFTRLYGNLHSKSKSNVLGYADPQMDGLLADLQTAGDKQQRQSVLDEIQMLVNETAPMVTIDAGRYYIPWNDNIHGIIPSSDGILLFNQAWRSGN